MKPLSSEELQTASYEKRLRHDLAKVCGAKLRNKPGEFCANIKGYGTPHLGTGRCKYHGGLRRGDKAKMQAAKEALKARQHSEFEFMSTEELAEHYARDPDILNLSKDIGLAEAVLHRIDKDDPANWTIISRLIDSITKSKRAKHEIEKEKRFVLPIPEVQRLIQMLFALIGKYVLEETLRHSLMQEFREAVSSPLLPEGSSGLLQFSKSVSKLPDDAESPPEEL